VRLRALECLAACGLALGGSRLSATERAARRLIEAAPYRETGYHYLIKALAERGRQAEALQVFDDVRRLLQAELGVPPSAGLRGLHERLLGAHGMPPRGERDDPLAVGPATTTALFTDLVCGEDAGSALVEELRNTHGRLLRHAVAVCGGQMLREAPDGSVAVFDRARDGLECAVGLQQSVERHNGRHAMRRLAVRVALHSDERRFAAEALASIARRVGERAAPGQILASAGAQSFAAPGRHVRDLDAMQLTGGAEPIGVVEVIWERAAQRPFALPSALRPREREQFVGRENELLRLWKLYERAGSGTCQVAFVRGEPGIGKTRLAIEFALRTHADGAVVLYGRCDEEPLLAHQPFVEALAHYVAACAPAELAWQVGSRGGELRRIVPELAERLPDLAQPLAGDPGGERYRLFEAVSALLCEAAVERPVVLVLDDLQWADKPSLLLLAHVVRYAGPTALLVLGTYREADVEPGHPLADTLADLQRASGYERVSLAALDIGAVAGLVRSYAGDQEPEVARVLFEETEGNPFYVVAMLRHLSESGAIDGRHGKTAFDVRLKQVGIPESVTDVIGGRIARLGQVTRRVLAIASVSGRDVELAVLEQMSEFGQDQLVESLEEAVRARVIAEVGDGGARYAFSHALIRETIYGGLGAARRSLLHRRMAESLEQAFPDHLDAHRAELAHHFARAGSTVDIAKAIEYAAGAGDSRSHSSPTSRRRRIIARLSA
jgi:hypothetical protein